MEVPGDEIPSREAERLRATLERQPEITGAINRTCQGEFASALNHATRKSYLEQRGTAR